MALSKEEERLKKMKKMSRVLGINIHQVRRPMRGRSMCFHQSEGMIGQCIVRI